MGSLLPYAVREFANADLEWLIHRQLFQKRIDVLQLEYTPLAQYRGAFRRIVTALFEHDVYFQSIVRGLRATRSGALGEVKARVEYLRALRYELRALPPFDQVQVCTPAQRDYLLAFLSGSGAEAARRFARRHRHLALRIPPGGPRAAHHALHRQFPARPEPRGARLVRARSDAA